LNPNLISQNRMSEVYELLPDYASII
jgi:hypothetical protein